MSDLITLPLKPRGDRNPKADIGRIQRMEDAVVATSATQIVREAVYLYAENYEAIKLLKSLMNNGAEDFQAVRYALGQAVKFKRYQQGGTK